MIILNDFAGLWFTFNLNQIVYCIEWLDSSVIKRENIKNRATPKNIIKNWQLWVPDMPRQQKTVQIDGITDGGTNLLNGENFGYVNVRFQ